MRKNKMKESASDGILQDSDKNANKIKQKFEALYIYI
jgi:hypothetical protein